MRCFANLPGITRPVYRGLSSLQSRRRSGREHLHALALATDGDTEPLQAQGPALLESLHAEAIVPATALES